MIRTYHYPLLPNAKQAAVLQRWLGDCRALYNGALEERISAFRKLGKSPSRYSQQKSLTELRAEDPYWANIPVNFLRSALLTLDRAYQGFFRRVKAGETPGFPRFKGRDRLKSFSLMSEVPTIKGNRINIPKLGWVKFNLYRPIQGIIKDVWFKCSAGCWEVGFVCYIGEAPAVLTPAQIKTSVGIDLGLTNYLTLSSGQKLENPRYYRRGQEILAKRQRALALKRKGSKSRARAKLLVQRAHLHVSNQRAQHGWDLANYLVKNFDLIAYEDLTIRNMVRNQHLALSIYDASWGKFLHQLSCKAEEAGKITIAVNPRGTSQRCSGCQEVVLKDLSERLHRCPRCSLVLDRDHNAALNIHARGLSAATSTAPAGPARAEAS